MAIRIFNKAIIALSAVLTLGLSGCSGCSPHTWSSESSETSVDPSSVTNVYEIKWVNYGNKLIYKDTVLEGETPVYHGEIPTREGTERDNYVFTGWSPEIVPAYKNATYKAKYKTEPKTFTVAFVAGNCTCQYSQDLIADVPYGTRVAIDGNAIIINGTRVTVEATPTEGESILHNYTFDRWSVYDGYEITGNTTISAMFNITDTLYDVRLMASGGGMVVYYTESTTDYEITITNGKSYNIYADGGEYGQPVSSDFRLVTYINGNPRYYNFGTWSPYEDFYTYDFDGWFYNGEPLLYGVEMTGNVLIEGRFHKVPLDYSYLFDFEINESTNDASIIGVKEEYRYTQMVDLSIPRTYEGYPVANIKNGALSCLYVSGTLAIPNTLISIEEMEDFASSVKPESSAYSKIVLEEGSTNFRVVNGVLYNYEMTEAITASGELDNYLDDGVFNMPSTVTYIWKSAFKYTGMTSVNIPSGVTFISRESFASTLLKTVNLPNTIETIRESAFRGSQLESLVLPDSVVSMYSCAFINNHQLRHVHFGSGLISYASDVFWGCENIEYYTVSEDNRYFGTYNGALYDKELKKLKSYPATLSYDDPVDNFAPSLEEIGYNAFDKCYFQTIHFPEGVKRLANMCFDYCLNLNTVYLPSTITYLGGNAFCECFNVTYMEYNGTIAQFNAIEKDSWMPWNKDLRNLTELVCTDGTIPLAA